VITGPKAGSYNYKASSLTVQKVFLEKCTHFRKCSIFSVVRCAGRVRVKVAAGPEEHV